MRGADERSRSRISRSLFCCISPPRDTSDEKLETSIIFESAQREDVAPKPSIPTSAPQIDRVDFKLLEDEKHEDEKKEQNAQVKTDSGGRKNCRYCLSGDGDFIAPCKCIGSQKWVHRECLKKWQRSCQIRKSTHPWYRDQTNPEKVCNVCLTKFDLDPPKYEEVVSGLTGNQVVSQIREGFMIVATKESSERSEATLVAHQHLMPYEFRALRILLSPWIRGVYLIIEITPDLRGQMVTAVNLTKELNRSPSRFQNAIRRFRHKKVQVKWMDSGPCDGVHGVGCLRATAREYVEEETSLNILHDMPFGLTVAGNLELVVEMCHKDWYNEKTSHQRNCENMESSAEPPLREVYACCGDGTWTREQLIGEIARGSWGMATFKTNDVFKVPNKPEPPAPDELYMMLQDANRPILPQENEMREDFDEALDPIPFQDTDEARQHREELRAQLLSRSASPPATIPQPEPTDDEVHITIEAAAVCAVTDESKEDINLEQLPSDLRELGDRPERTNTTICDP